MKHIISILIMAIAFCGNLYGQRFDDIYAKKNYKEIMYEFNNNTDQPQLKSASSINTTLQF